MKFTVLGTPRPQGSMRGFVVKGRAVLTSDNKRLKPWRDQVSISAIRRLGGMGPIERPLSVAISILFTFMRPKSAKGRERPTVKPDLDKLIRAVLDALTGVVFEDDSQVTHIMASKEYGEVESCTIEII